MKEVNQEDKWISSKEILATVEISRATLNNYIKLGILPRPVVRKPDVEEGGPKQMGYFPPGVLDTLRKVKAMKSDGLSMEVITAQFKPAKTAPAIETARGSTDSRAMKGPFESLPLFTDHTEKPLSGTLPKKRQPEPIAEGGGESPALLAFCALTAVLQDLERLRMEWLPEDLFSLIKRIWADAADIAGMNQGFILESREGSMTVMFSSEGDPDYLMKTMYTAMEMHKVKKRINLNLPSGPRSWPKSLHLNIGLSMGEEHVEKTKGLLSGSLTSPGFIIADATALANFARNGSIWATRDFLSRFLQGGRRLLRFGVTRSGVFEERTFSLIRDLAIEGRDCESPPCMTGVHDRLIGAEILPGPME